MVRGLSFAEGIASVRLLRGPLPEGVLEATTADIKRAVGAFDGGERRRGRARAGAGERRRRNRSDSGRGRHHRRGEHQGRRRQVDGRGEPGLRVGARRHAGRPARRRRLRSQPADHAGAVGAAARSRKGIRCCRCEKYGVAVMSMGFFLDDTSPVIWRGPLVTGLLRQFLKDVRWGDLDLLVIDLPPGTGDAAADPGPAGAPVGRRDRDDAAGGVAGRRRARHRDVPPGQHAGPRRRREHERLRLPDVRRRTSRSSAAVADSAWPRASVCRCWRGFRSCRVGATPGRRRRSHRSRRARRAGGQGVRRAGARGHRRRRGGARAGAAHRWLTARWQSCAEGGRMGF